MDRSDYLTIFICEISSMFRISSRTTRKYIKDQRWDQIPPPSLRQAGRLVWFPADIVAWMDKRGEKVEGEVRKQTEGKRKVTVKTFPRRKGNKTKEQRVAERKEADRMIKNNCSSDACEVDTEVEKILL